MIKKKHDIQNQFNDAFVSNNVYLKHEYDHNHMSIINDVNNSIDKKYEEIKNKELTNNNSIKELKKKIKCFKKDLKKLKKTHNKKIINKYENLKTNSNKQNIIIINRLIDQIKHQKELLKYEVVEKNKSITKNHIKSIINKLLKLMIKIKNMNIYHHFNDYLDNYVKLSNIVSDDYPTKITTNELTTIINISLKYLSIDMFNNKDIIMTQRFKLLEYNFNNLKLNENKKKLNEDENSYKKSYNSIISNLNECSKKLNKLMHIKQKIEYEMINIFKQQNEILKVDNMSKKSLQILDKMNWVVIDPGMNSLLTMMSKDNKTKFSYSKSQHLNKTKRKQILKKIEKIKKEKITTIENELTKDNKRLKTSNTYKLFNEYFQLKMKMHDSIVKLHNDERLNKLKWYGYINDKRSQSKLVNDIKKKFGSDCVLIMGDWCMNKKHIKSISTPNKKYEKLLNKNFMMLTLNEFRTSKIDNKTNNVLNNLIKKQDYNTMPIKSVYNLEKLKKK